MNDDHHDLVIEMRTKVATIVDALSNGASRMRLIEGKIDAEKDRVNNEFKSVRDEINTVNLSVGKIYAYAAGLGTVAGVLSALLINAIVG